MKNVYEVPAVEELLIASADVITASLAGGADDSGSDQDWDLLG